MTNPVEDLILHVDASKVPGYRQDAADDIVRHMDGGLSFPRACSEAGVSLKDAYRWRRLNVENFAERISQSLVHRSDVLLDEAHDAITSADSKEALTQAKLLFEEAKWYAERLQPDRYSPTLITATRGEDGRLGPASIQVTVFVPARVHEPPPPLPAVSVQAELVGGDG